MFEFVFIKLYLRFNTKENKFIDRRKIKNKNKYYYLNIN